MTTKLDYSRTWQEATALLRAHRDGVIAIAALFTFLPDWIAKLFAGAPDMEGVTTLAAYIAAYETYHLANWPLLLPMTLIGFFGGVALYMLLTRTDLSTIGSALSKAAALLPLYFIVQLAGNLFMAFGLMLFILPGLYIAGRLVPLGAVTVGESERGFAGVIRRTWDLTRGQGWAIFFLVLVVFLVASLTAIIIGLIVGLICRLLAGPTGVPFIETGVDAALGTVVMVMIMAVSVAVYRGLKGKG